MTAAFAVSAIGFYQQFLSPYKGFRCAHRVRHGRMSCSQFAKRLIEKVGLLRFAPLFRRRLAKCGMAARTMKAGAAPPHVEHKREQEQTRKRDSVWDGCDPGCDAGCAPDAGGCDMPDVNPLGALDGCDCGGCDLSI